METVSKRVVHFLGIRGETQDLTVAQAKVMVLYRLARNVVGNTKGIVIELWAPILGVEKLVI